MVSSFLVAGCCVSLLLGFFVAWGSQNDFFPQSVKQQTIYVVGQVSTFLTQKIFSANYLFALIFWLFWLEFFASFLF